MKQIESKENLFQFLNAEFKTPSKENRGIKRNIDSQNCSKTEDPENTEYTKETYPDIDDTDEDSKYEDLQGITFKGKSRNYISAYNRLRENLVKGAAFRVKDNHLKVTATPKGKPMKVQLTKVCGEKGHAQLQMYKPGKKGATILITRSKGDTFNDVKIIAEEFIETFLGAYLKGNITGEKILKEHRVSDQEDNKPGILAFKCEKCDKSFLTKQGSGIHAAWHIRKENIKKNIN